MITHCEAENHILASVSVNNDNLLIIFAVMNDDNMTDVSYENDT